MDFVGRRSFDMGGGKILVRSQNWIGDVVIATASLGCIRRSFPEASVSVLAKPWVIPILAHNPHIDELIEYDGEGLHKGMRGMMHLVRYLRSRRFQGAILLQRAFEAALIASLAGIPARMGYTTDGRGLLLTHKLRSSKKEFDVPRLEHDLKLLEGFGLNVEEKGLVLPIGASQMGKAQERLQELGVAMDEPLIGFSPGAVGSLLKRWYPERFAELALRIRNTHPARILLFGAPDEETLGEEICRMAGNAELINLAGRTSLEEAMALIGLCGLFVTNDSGLMHVAAALDVPLVCIFGPTDPRRTSPWSKRYKLVRDEGVDCYGCKMRKCDQDHRCMDVVTVERAYAGVLEVIERFGLDDPNRRRRLLTLSERAVPIITADMQRHS